MKKILAIVVALVLCLGMVSLAQAEAVKVGVLVPAVTHGWVGGITYNAEQYCKELEAAGTIEYKLYTSSNAEEMTTQSGELSLPGAEGDPCCMGTAAADSVEVLQGFLREELGDAQVYAYLAANLPRRETARLFRALSEEEKQTLYALLKKLTRSCG